MGNHFEGFERKYFTTSDGVKLHYEEKGSGKAIILLHGLSGSYANYCMLAPALSESYHVYVLDMRFHGLSDQPEFGMRISRLAKDVYEFQQYLGVEKATWVGHSMGNSVIWSMIELFGQDHIESVVILDQSPCQLANPEETEEQARGHAGLHFDMWDFYNANLRSEDDANASVFKYFRIDQYPADDPAVYALLGSFEKLPSAFKQIGKLHVDHLQHDWRDLIPRIAVPTLVVGAGQSYATTPESSKWIADNIPNSTLLILEDATHVTVAMNYTEQIVAKIKELLH